MLIPLEQHVRCQQQCRRQRRQALLTVQHRCQIADVNSAWPLLQWDGTGEIGIVAAQPRRWKHRYFASIQSLHLLVRQNKKLNALEAAIIAAKQDHAAFKALYLNNKEAA